MTRSSVNKRPYRKQPLSIEGQLRRLEERGIVLADREGAHRVLERINYYRLSGYWRVFRDHDDTFKRSDAFELAVRLHDLDRELRRLVLDMSGRIEVSLRSRIAHELAMEHGAFAHESSDAWLVRADMEEWKCALHREIRRSKDDFAIHFRTTYKEWPCIPIWAACELMSFGLLSKLYEGMDK